MPLDDTTYQPADTDNNLLRKILFAFEAIFEAAPSYRLGDTDNNLLRKILDLLSDASVARPGDTDNNLLRKLASRIAIDRVAFGAPNVAALYPMPADLDTDLLRKILTWLNYGSVASALTVPLPGDNKNILLRKWLIRVTLGIAGFGGEAPTITTQPQTQTVDFASNVIFSVVATGTEPISYQWQKDGVDLGGETADTLSLSAVDDTDEGDYTVIVSNEIGSTTSDIATLTVNPLTPASFPNLYAWYKADSLALADGTAVGAVGSTEWQDSSGNGRHLRQPSAGERPHFKTNIVGSLPVVRFVEVDGVSTESLAWVTGNFASVSGVGTGAFTVIAIVSVTNTAAVVISGPPGFNNRLEKRRGGANTINTTLPGIFTSAVFASGISDLVCCVYRRQDGAAGDASFRENTTARGTYNATAALTLSVIGACPGIGEGMSGDLAEMCVYQGHLSDADVDALYTGYFKPKWTTLP